MPKQEEWDALVATVANQQAMLAEIFERLDALWLGLATGDVVPEITMSEENIEANAITANKINVGTLSAIAANMGVLTAGEIDMYAGTWDTNATGFRLTASEICGQNAGTDQVLIASSTGKLTAGAGNVTLDTDGVTIASSATPGLAQKLKFGATGNIIGHIYCVQGASSEQLYAVINPGAGDEMGLIVDDHATVGRFLLQGIGTKPLQFNDSNTEIWEDASHNLTFKDAGEGTKTLAQLSTYEFFPLLNPWTSTSWDGDDKADTTGTVIDVSAAFGETTTGIVAYAVRISARGSDAGYFMLAPQSDASAEFSVGSRPSASGVYDDGSGIVPATAAGDFYYASSACDQHWIQIFGYWKMP